MPILLKELVRRIPVETETLVSRTRTRYNAMIRRILRTESGLRLSSGGTSDDEDRDGHSVKIRVVPGLPAELEHVAFDDDKWLAILLAPWKSTLSSLHLGLEEIDKELLPSLLVRPDQRTRFPNLEESVMITNRFVETLLKDAVAFDLVKEIHSIEDDILGRYSYRVTPFTGDVTEATIDLYWGVIGLVARALGVSIEGLTVKVLAHELAHAYTHLGADIGGDRWDAGLFAKADRRLKEGLAQYYTTRVVERMRSQIPEAEIAYKKLLPIQPEAYRTHVSWVEGGRSPEEIRFAMISLRRQRKSTLSEFSEALETAEKGLRS